MQLMPLPACHSPRYHSNAYIRVLYMYTHTHTHTHLYACMYVRMYVCMYVCVIVCVCVCVYIYIYVYNIRGGGVVVRSAACPNALL